MIYNNCLDIRINLDIDFDPEATFDALSELAFDITICLILILGVLFLIYAWYRICDEIL